MDLPELLELLMDTLEKQAQQTLLNQCLFHMVKENGGQLTLDATQVMDLSKDNIALAIELNTKEATITLKTATEEEAIAFDESFSADKH